MRLPVSAGAGLPSPWVPAACPTSRDIGGVFPVTRALTDDILDDLAEHLRGSCQSLDAALEQYDLDENALSLEDCQALDERVLLCGTCGWWDEADAMVDGADGHEYVCPDCVEDDD